MTKFKKYVSEFVAKDLAEAMVQDGLVMESVPLVREVLPMATEAALGHGSRKFITQDPYKQAAFDATKSAVVDAIHMNTETYFVWCEYLNLNTYGWRTIHAYEEHLICMVILSVGDHFPGIDHSLCGKVVRRLLGGGSPIKSKGYEMVREYFDVLRHQSEAEARAQDESGTWGFLKLWDRHQMRIPYFSQNGIQGT